MSKKIRPKGSRRNIDIVNMEPKKAKLKDDDGVVYPKTIKGRILLFVEQYLRCWNAVSAAEAAGYSEKHASQMGFNILSRPYVKDYIRSRLKQVQMETNDALARLAMQASANMGEFIVEREVEHLNIKNGNITKTKQFVFDIEKLNRFGLGFLIKKYSARDGTIEFHDPQTAIQMILRTHGAFKDNYNFNVSGNRTPEEIMTEVLKQARKNESTRNNR